MLSEYIKTSFDLQKNQSFKENSAFYNDSLTLRQYNAVKAAIPFF